VTLLITNGCILTMSPAGDVHWPGWVLVLGDRIADLGAGEPPAEMRAQVGRVIDASHMAVLPGLVNAHTHLEQTFMRGLGDDKPLLQWLKQVMWPLQAAMTPDDMHLASLLGLVENLRCGVAAVNQHHKLPGPDFTDAALAAAETVGLRFQLARGWVDAGGGAERPDDILAEMERLHGRWQGAGDGCITISNGPMAPWRCSDETMRQTVAQARSWGAPTHIHVAETKDEIDLMIERTGRRHLEWLDSLGALGPDIQLVHCVHVSPTEIDLIAASDSVVVHCPTSNMYLASGIAPIPAMVRRGVAVALGTDGSASHNSQDLLETMKTAILLAKTGSADPTALSTLDILRMATTVGARIMAGGDGPDLAGPGHDTGRLAPGCKADLTLVNLNRPHIQPVHRPESALVYNCNGPDVHTVIVAGRILLDAGRVTMLDEASLLGECRRAARKLLHRAGM
jgi:5-methylthioadenosine/S-adenosylhomocysteine deaminase